MWLIAALQALYVSSCGSVMSGGTVHEHLRIPGSLGIKLVQQWVAVREGQTCNSLLATLFGGCRWRLPLPAQSQHGGDMPSHAIGA